jgi:iron complex transport system permease protein
VSAALHHGLVGVLTAGAGGTSERIILCGIASPQLFTALTSYIVTTSANAEQARGVLFWLLGSLSGVRWPDVYLAAPVCVAGLIACLSHARALDAFAFGKDAAQALVISVTRVQIVLLGTTAAMTASVVSMVGSIGFVGLVIPHAARFLVGSGHGRLLPAAAIGGAIFMVFADIVSKIISASTSHAPLHRSRTSYCSMSLQITSTSSTSWRSFHWSPGWMSHAL